MIHLGLIGYPLGHSLSPKLHTAALNACDLQGDYSLFPIAPGNSTALAELLHRVRSGELHGLNVTVPHKQTVIQFLDELTPTAQAIGAVNTIYLQDGKLLGENTDVLGFLTDLTNFFQKASFPRGVWLRGETALVLGAGGSARAVAYALTVCGWTVIITARRFEQANELAQQFKLNVAEYNASTFQRADVCLIVNTTPVGMSPKIDNSPWPDGLPFPRKATLYDLVYNPRETLLIKQARAAGLYATTGLGMLIEQAALAFELWTGHNPSRDAIRESVE